MRVELLYVDDVAPYLKEIDHPRIIMARTFTPTGIFSQQIFGPVRSGQCACSRSKDTAAHTHDGKICPVCGVELTSSSTRRTRFAKIALPFPVLNPLVLTLIGNRPAKKIIAGLLSYKSAYTLVDGELQTFKDGEGAADGVEVWRGLEGAISYLRHLLLMDRDEEDEETVGLIERLPKTFKYIREHFDKITTFNNIIVIPPEFRPCGRDENESSDINRYYRSIIKISTGMKNIPCELLKSTVVYQTNFRHLQQTVQELFDYVAERMSKKTGLIRANILGKRTDFSGRAVISPNPDLMLDECGVPYKMVLELIKPQLVAHLVGIRDVQFYNQAIAKIDACIENNDTSLFEIVQKFCANRYCVLNRQPTLHRMSVLGFKIKVHTGNTIQIHPMICSPLNADFDGDAMAIYIPITTQAMLDVVDKIGIWNNLVSPSTLDLVPTPNQDIILGIYAATKDDSPPIHEIKGEKMSFGKYMFNTCLPDDYPIIKSVVSKKSLMRILNDIVMKYSKINTMSVLDAIKTLGFNYSTLHGYTLALDDLVSPELTEIAKNLTGKYDADMEFMATDKRLAEVLKALPFSEYIESGARGSWVQAKQMVLARGYVADADNKIRPEIIRSSLVKGLTPTEMFASCWGTRKGLLDTALATGDSGYLTRQLIYSTTSVELDETVKDCGTTDTLEVVVNDLAKAKSLMFRYYIDENGVKRFIKRDTLKSLVGKTLQVRSPIFCKNKKICKTCYGKLTSVLHSTNIGIIATQAIGERAVQLVLRTFHTSGVSQGGSGGANEDIISGMGLTKSLFHSPDKNVDLTRPENLVNKIYSVFEQYGSIQTVHFETVVAAMMWNEDTPWRLAYNRGAITPEYVSILQIPSRLSWLLGCAFSNFKQKLVDGLISGDDDVTSAITTLFRF